MARVLQYDPFHQPCSNFAHTRKTVSSTFRSATLFPLMILLTNRQRVQLKDTGPPSPARRWPRKIACKEGDSWLMRQDPPRPDSWPRLCSIKKVSKNINGPLMWYWTVLALQHTDSLGLTGGGASSLLWVRIGDGLVPPYPLICLPRWSPVLMLDCWRRLIAESKLPIH